MSHKRRLNGLYVITDNNSTPSNKIFSQVKEVLEGGATIIQLRDKKSSDEVVKQTALKLQELCKDYDATFILNDKIDLAIELQCDGLHIGKSDYERFEEIRKVFKGIIGISCYADIALAKKFENLGADYVAFGSFYTSPTKPDSNIISLETLSYAKENLSIPICAIGGINSKNLYEIMRHKPDMVSIISDIWNSNNIEKQSSFYKNKF